MVSKKTIDRIFMLIFGVFGFFLFVVSANSFNLMKKECIAPIIYDGMLAIMTIGAILTTMAVSYMICNVSNRVCYTEETSSLYISDFYLGICCVLTLILSVLSLTMGSSLKNYQSCITNQPNLKTNIWFIFGTCLVLLLGSGSIIAYNILEKDFSIKKNELR